MRASRLFIAALFLLLPQTSTAGTDSDIFALIESLRPVADQLQVDGQQSDWSGIPMFSDPSGDAGGDGSRDIIAAAIAARSTDLVVLITTAGNPSQEDLAFSIDVDFMSRWRADIRIHLNQQEPHRLTIFPEGQSEISTNVTGLEMAIGSVVEVKIPYAALARVLPANMAAALTGKNLRPFIRVRPQSHRNSGTELVDYGPEVASYRLVPTPYALDPALPQSGKPVLAIEFPMDGKWFIHQGAFANTGSHSTRWAYDLSIRDSIGFRSAPPDSPSSEDYYNWDQPVFAPTSSRVIETFDGSPDGSPLEPPPSPAPPDNRVLLDMGNNIGLSLRHLRQGSIAVNQGDTVAADDFLGSVGDSGDSGAPHLHMMFVDLPSDTSTLPLALTKVRVSLNSKPDDPWARDLALWEPREAFFIEALAAYSGPLAVAALALPEAEVNLPYTASLQILGGTPPYTVSVVKGSLPAGLSINDSSVTGTPSRAKRIRFTIEVRDQNNASVTRDLSVTTVKAITLSTARLKSASVGRSYSARLKAKGGKGPFTWSVPSGNLPPDINWNPNSAELFGTASTEGTFPLVFRVTDVLGAISEKELVLTVKP